MMSFLQLSKDSAWMREQKKVLEEVLEEEEEEEGEEKTKQNELLEKKVMEWAQDLKTMSEVRL